MVTWVDHRLLVREAVANLTSELQNNRKELSGLFASLQEGEGQHFSDVLALMRRIPFADRPNMETVERWRSLIDVAIAGVTPREQLARQLQRRYEYILAEH